MQGSHILLIWAGPNIQTVGHIFGIPGLEEPLKVLCKILQQTVAPFRTVTKMNPLRKL